MTPHQRGRGHVSEDDCIVDWTLRCLCEEQTNDSIPVSLQSFITAVQRRSASEINTNPHYRQVTLTIGQLMALDTTIRIQNQLSSAYHSRKHEPPTTVYVAQMFHSKTHNLSMISNISKFKMCISQECFIQLSVGIGNTVIDMNKKEGVVLPTNLQKSLFSTASINNIGVATKSLSGVTSLHGTVASINQHMSSENQGQFHILPGTLSTDVKLKHQPKWYTEVPPAPAPPPNSFAICVYFRIQTTRYDRVSPPELLEEQDWLNDQNITLWAVFHAKKCLPITKKPDISAMLPIWRDDSESQATIKHLLDILSHATGYLNPGQAAIIRFDQPLYAIAKKL